MVEHSLPGCVPVCRWWQGWNLCLVLPFLWGALVAQSARIACGLCKGRLLILQGAKRVIWHKVCNYITGVWLYCVMHLRSLNWEHGRVGLGTTLKENAWVPVSEQTHVQFRLFCTVRQEVAYCRHLPPLQLPANYIDIYIVCIRISTHSLWYICISQYSLIAKGIQEKHS